MGSDFLGTASIDLNDKRVLLKRPPQEALDVVVSDSTNVDSGATPTTLLPPGTVLLEGASDGIHYDDTSGGAISTQPAVESAESVDADWNGKTITLTIDGVDIVTVTLTTGTPAAADVVTDLNANDVFRAHALASVSSTTKVTVTAHKRGAAVHLKVNSNLTTAFGDSGTEDRGTDGKWVVTTKACDQLNPAGTAADARVPVVRLQAGVELDESALRWASSGTLHQDFYRVAHQNGVRFA